MNSIETVPTLQHFVDTVPEEMRAGRRWVMVKRGCKVPLQLSGRSAKANDSRTWCDFGAAYLVARSRGLSLGYEFHESDGFVGIDLDKVRDPATGAVEPWAMEIVESLDSYTEISPSGRGLHVIVRAVKPGPRCRSAKNLPHVELYGDKRYFTVTGNRLPGTPAMINDRQDALESLYRRLVGPEPGRSSRDHDHDQDHAKRGSHRASGHDRAGGNTLQAPVCDHELLARAFGARNGAKLRALWSGDLSAYRGDHSSGDAALCAMLAYWTGPDPDRIDRLFRQSGLMRDKWDRADYRDRTIQGAIQTCGRFYSWPQPQTQTSPDVAETCLTYHYGHEQHSDKSDTFGSTACPTPLRGWFAGATPENANHRIWGQHRCGSATCPGCHAAWQQQWADHLAWGHQTDEGRTSPRISSCDGPDGKRLRVQILFCGPVEADDLPRVTRSINRWKKSKRRRVPPEFVQYLKIETPNGTHVVSTVPFEGSVPRSVAAVRQGIVQFLASIDRTMRGQHCRPVSTSEGWGLPDRERNYTLVGRPTGVPPSDEVVEHDLKQHGGESVTRYVSDDGLPQVGCRVPAGWSDEEFMSRNRIVSADELRQRRKANVRVRLKTE